MRMKAASVRLAAALAAAPVSAIDVWDSASEDDNSTGTDNGLTHGTEQVHDLAGEVGVADQDWYIFTSVARSSYEVIVDGMTGDLNLSVNGIQRMGSGVDVLQSAFPHAGYYAIRWQNTTGTNSDQWIRVSGAACGSACTTADQYRIRMYETTYSIPRFNNSGTQTTVLIISNAAAVTCSLTLHFYAVNSTLLTSAVTALDPRQTLVLQTAALAATVGQSGSIYVAHTCGYGGLSGKAVALEPSTGFSFDTPMVPRPR